VNEARQFACDCELARVAVGKQERAGADVIAGVLRFVFRDLCLVVVSAKQIAHESTLTHVLLSG
jgi:hypothetical protein